MKTPKSKSAPSQEFQDVCLWYKMEVAEFSFESVCDNIRKILQEKLGKHLPEYAMTVGVICIYARPFTNNYPVGELSDEIVPTEFKKLHGNIMRLRHTLFAHAQASFSVGKGDYPNEVVIEHNGVIPRICVPRVTVQQSMLEQMVPLVEALIQKTNYHRSKFAKKYANAVRKLGKGEFRLNVVDPDGPMFIPLSDDEKLVRQRKKSIFDIDSII